jgi:spore photoproduct lyase
MWKPKEIIVHESVKDDLVTSFFLAQCPHVPVEFVENGRPKDIVAASKILSGSGPSMLDKILAGKQVVYISPAKVAVDVFTMPDDRMVCPHFDRLKLASNGCFYQCDWCYLKLTYRAAFPFITIRVQYDKIKNQINKKLSKVNEPVIFNSGELADSLSMEHLTRAGREFIPWFGRIGNGYLFMLTKSDNVNAILELPHNGHTIIAWSINNEKVSRKFEIGAPIFERRLEAAYKVQKAGYPIRLRLDPIVPFEGWQKAYSQTVKRIFDRLSPERITIGTLRFEKGFYNMRNSIFATGAELPSLLDNMEPMFTPKSFTGFQSPKSGKHSFSENQRVEIFRFIIDEILKYSDCRIALCKESPVLWNRLGLELSRCSCVCQLDYADMAK